MLAAEEPFSAGGHGFAAGSFLIPAEGNGLDLREELQRAGSNLGLTIFGVDQLPKVPAHPVPAPRIALVHNWMSTQNEGWVRLALDNLKIPYHYVSDHVLRDTADLRGRYEVILLGPAPVSSQRLVAGIPRRGPEPMPWKKSELMPNVGTSPDQSADIRGGLGLEGVVNLKRFVEQGGLLITFGGNASLAIDFGLTEGVSIVQTRELQARGSVLNAVFTDKRSPIAYGYGDRLAIYFSQSPVFRVSRTGGLIAPQADSQAGRPSGRGTATDPDIPQGRPFVPPPPKPEVKPGEEPPLTDDQREYLRHMLPPPEALPRVIMRFAEEKDLLVAGMLAGGKEIASHPAVVDVPVGKGHVVMFANNPMWRQQTQGSFFLVFNAILHHNHLDAGREAPAAGQ
jgi:hypothetical protein